MYPCISVELQASEINKPMQGMGILSLVVKNMIGTILS